MSVVAGGKKSRNSLLRLRLNPLKRMLRLSLNCINELSERHFHEF